MRPTRPAHSTQFLPAYSGRCEYVAVSASCRQAKEPQGAGPEGSEAGAEDDVLKLINAAESHRKQSGNEKRSKGNRCVEQELREEEPDSYAQKRNG